MRDDVRQLIEQTLAEVASGARTLDPATEIDVVLTEHGFQVVKITQVPSRPLLIFDDEGQC
jgi:hypothetical protein